ncbi:hypothetical protein [Nocardia harenae]|uniref:hypothetical protein n=1 Tax=Nocardia harenae TaxID=358707 RepID=UPI000832E40F|nr:hypothetical protein [Nocardia harenae]
MSTAAGANRVTEWWTYSQGLRLRHRLAVLACDGAEVIAEAGGWLFDRAQAGWEVAVVLAEVTEVVPLQLLGATVLELEGPLSVPVHHTWPELLIVAPELLAADARVRDGVLRCLEYDLLDIVVWDRDLPAEFEPRFLGAHYRLSAAARAFKARALALGGNPGADVSAPERFRVSSPRMRALAECFVLDAVAVPEN